MSIQQKKKKKYCNNCRTEISIDEPLYSFVIKQKIGWGKTPSEDNWEVGHYHSRSSSESWVQCLHCYDLWRQEVDKSKVFGKVWWIVGLIFNAVLTAILGKWFFSELKKEDLKNSSSWVERGVYTVKEYGDFKSNFGNCIFASIMVFLIGLLVIWIVKKIFQPRADRCRIRVKKICSTPSQPCFLPDAKL